MPGWHLAHTSMTPAQRYAALEKAKTITPDWNTISILKMHHSSEHKVGRWGIRFSNTYYQADELTQITGQMVDILFHAVQPPYAPSSITVVHNNSFLCEAFPAELRHMTGDSPVDIMYDTERQNRPALEIKSTLSRIRQSADAILPDKAKSKPSERVQMYDYSFAPSVEEEPPHGCSRQSSIKKGLAFLFGEN